MKDLILKAGLLSLYIYHRRTEFWFIKCNTIGFSFMWGNHSALDASKNTEICL